MAILFVAAESFELKPFATHLTGLRKLKWPIAYAYEGILEGRRIMLAANGPGPKLGAHVVEIALRAVMVAELSSSRLEAVVSTGLCGAVIPELADRQIVVGTEVLNRQSQQRFPCAPIYPGKETRRGVILSQDRIAATAAEKRELAEMGAIAVEMEAAGVAERTQRAGLPFYCIKAVSDRAEESFAVDLNGMRTNEGRFSRGKIVSYALTHPSATPELLHLRRRAGAAARALGDFLVSCRITSDANSDPAQSPDT